MKKLFALMLALMLALAGVSVVSAEDATAEAPAIPVTTATSSGSITLSMKLNGDAIAAMTGAADENAAKMVKTIVDLVNNLSITMTSDGVDAEMFVKVKDEPVAGLAMLKDTDKLFFLSDIFPNYILRIDQGAAAGGAGMPQISLDPEQMTAMMEPVSKLMNDFMSRIGESEAVNETFFDTAFTVKNPINLTTKEALQMALGAAKEVVEQEGFKSLLEQLKNSGMQISFDAGAIDKKIEEINNTKDEDLPVLDASVYSNEAQDGLFVVDATKGEETVRVITGGLSGGFVSEVNVPNKAYVIVSGNTTTGDFDMNVQIMPSENMLINIDGSFKATAEGFTGIFEAKMNDVELGGISITGTPNGVLTGEFSVADKKEIGIQDMQDQSSEAMKGFMADVMTGAMTAMGKIMAVFPDFGTIMQSMMPQTQAQPQQ